MSAKPDIVQVLLNPEKDKRKKEKLDQIRKERKDNEKKEETFQPKVNKKVNQRLAPNYSSGNKNIDLYKKAVIKNENKKAPTQEELDYQRNKKECY